MNNISFSFSLWQPEYEYLLKPICQIDLEPFLSCLSFALVVQSQMIHSQAPSLFCICSCKIIILGNDCHDSGHSGGRDQLWFQIKPSYKYNIDASF